MTNVPTDEPRVVKRKPLRLADWQWSAIGVILVVGGWQLYGTFSNPSFMPTFTRTVGELWNYIEDRSRIKGLGPTFELLVAGLALGALAGIPAGLFLGVNRLASDIFAPYIQ